MKKITFLFFVLLGFTMLGFSIQIFAQISWTGTISTDWSNTANWDIGMVPGSGDDVVIPSGLTNYPVVDEVATCNNLSINDGGILTVVTNGTLTVGGDLSVGTGTGGEFQMDNGTCTVTGNYYTEIGSTTDINGGTLNFHHWRRNATTVWSKGIRELSGGTINTVGGFVWSAFDVSAEMTGSFTVNVGGYLRIDGSTISTITGGTFILHGTAIPGGVIYCNAPAWNTGYYISVYNLIIDDGGAGNTFAFAYDDATMRSGVHIVNDFSIISGSVITYNGAGYTENFTVGNDFTVAPGTDFLSDANTPISVNGDLTLESNASAYASWIDNGSLNVSGSEIVQVSMAGPQWHTISAPVSGIESGLFTGLYLQNFDEPTNSWNDIIPTNIPIMPGVGFAMYSNESQTIQFIGPYNSGAINNASLTRTNLGWNMAGNPYPSPIDWDAIGWTKTNVADAIYVEDNGNWATWIAGTGTGNGSNLIAPGQGFFVECTAPTGGTLGYTDAIRTHTRVGYLKSDVTDFVKMKVEGNGHTDDMVIRFLDDATEDFDYSYDAHKMFAYNVKIPQIYSIDNGYMAINSLPATEMVPIGFRTTITGEFTIVVSETSEFNYIILEDLFTSEQTNLLTNSYTFTANFDDYEDRFIVHFTPMLASENMEEISNIYSYHKNIYVSVPENSKGNITVYDMMGKEVTNATINNTMNIITLEKSAYYIVKVLCNENTVTKKVYIK